MLLLSLKPLKAVDRTEIYNAYISGRMDLWKKVIDRMNSIENKSDSFLLELVNYQYGYIGYCISYNKEKEAVKYLDLAGENIDFLEKQKFKLSSVYAYRSAFYGMRMELNPLLVPFYGLKSIRYARLALELDGNNYLAWLQNGYVKSNSPASAGGSKKEGLEFYVKAREIIEMDAAAMKENWNYLNVLTIIGQSYHTLGDYPASRDIFQHILRLEPLFTYVRDDLYPALLKEMKQ